MDLNVAADRTVTEKRNLESTRIRVFTMIATASAALCLLTASTAMALDGIDLSQPVEAAATGECSKLIQIKYPFVSCEGGVIGLADGDATWENSRQIPIGSDFVEGNGYWGDDLNQD